MRSDWLERLDFEAVRGKRLLAALSGGADSVALVCLLHEAREKYAFTLSAAHFNHHIRGKDADEDAAFCRRLCRKLNIPFFEGDGDVPAEAARLHMGMETAAREMRYRFLYKIMREHDFDLLVTAHHMDDQAETVLMHLLRGTGPEGISGMEVFSGEIYRPLLKISKAELTDYLMRKGMNWREDITNSHADNPRNALRLNVLPEIEKSYPKAAEAICRYGELARLESDYMQRQTQLFAQERLTILPDGHRISLEGGYEEALLRRLIRQICGSGLLSKKLEEIMLLAGEKRGKTEISKEIYAEKTPSALYFLQKERKKSADVPLALPGETRFGESCTILAQEVSLSCRRSKMNEEVLDKAALQGAVVRTRRAGDRIRPLGCGEKLLSDYLTDKKIDRPLRENLPLLAKGEKVLWVCGLGISEEAKIRPETRSAVKLTYITDEKAEV